MTSNYEEEKKELLRLLKNYRQKAKDQMQETIEFGQLMGDETTGEVVEFLKDLQPQVTDGLNRIMDKISTEKPPFDNPEKVTEILGKTRDFIEKQRGKKIL